MRSNILRWAQRRFPKDAGAGHGGSASSVSSLVSVGPVMPVAPSSASDVSMSALCVVSVGNLTEGGRCRAVSWRTLARRKVVAELDRVRVELAGR